jgi:hypothetical protein
MHRHHYRKCYYTQGPLTVTFILATVIGTAVKLARFCGKIKEQSPCAASTEPVLCTTFAVKSGLLVDGSTEGD